MVQEQGLQLLRIKIQDSSNLQGAEDLIQALGSIPLAISQAAAFISRRKRLTGAQYLSMLLESDKKKESLLDEAFEELRRDEEVSNSVVSTWQISFENIRERRPSAADLLSLMCFFSPQEIPGWILRKHYSSEENDEERNDRAYEEDLDVLQAYSFISTPNNNNCFDMHPLVRFCTRVWLSARNDLKVRERDFIQLVASNISSHFSQRKIMQQLAAHVDFVLDFDPESQESTLDHAKVLHGASEWMANAGSYEAASNAMLKTLSIQRRLLGPIHGNTLCTAAEYREILRLGYNLERSRTVLEDTLEAIERTSNPVAETRGRILKQLAYTLCYQHELEAAENMVQRAMKDSQDSGSHELILDQEQCLAFILERRGDFLRAEELQRRAVEGQTAKCGDLHPTTLIAMSEYVRLLLRQHKHAEAERTARHISKNYEILLGDESVLSMHSAYQLGVALSRKANTKRRKCNSSTL